MPSTSPPSLRRARRTSWAATSAGSSTSSSRSTTTSGPPSTGSSRPGARRPRCACGRPVAVLADARLPRGGPRATERALAMPHSHEHRGPSARLEAAGGPATGRVTAMPPSASPEALELARAAGDPAAKRTPYNRLCRGVREGRTPGEAAAGRGTRWPRSRPSARRPPGRGSSAWAIRTPTGAPRRGGRNLRGFLNHFSQRFRAAARSIAGAPRARRVARHLQRSARRQRYVLVIDAISALRPDRRPGRRPGWGGRGAERRSEWP
jgi:hypothetical protein